MPGITTPGVLKAIEFIRWMMFEMLPYEWLRCFAVVLGITSIGALPRLFGFTHGD